MSDCKHLSFTADVVVNRIEDSGRFMAEITIRCVDCGIPFEFQGLPCGLNLDGAAVGPDKLEARLSIQPSGKTPPPALGGVTGFLITEPALKVDPLKRFDFVFMDDSNRPFRCRSGEEEDHWLYRWQHDRWVSLRTLTPTEITSMNERALNPEAAEIWEGGVPFLNNE